MGWAFFCRYGSCMEAELEYRGVQLIRDVTLEWNNVVVQEVLRPGLYNYRRIRNMLHREDGASLDGPHNWEFQLMPQHMERFCNLSSWCN